MDKLEFLKERLSNYLQAERAILTGAQSYMLGDRSLTRADLKQIRAEIDQLIVEINVSESNQGRVKRVVFLYCFRRSLLALVFAAQVLE